MGKRNYGSGITLEAFTHPLQPSHMMQALNISRLVMREEDWLREARPGTLERYYYPSVQGKKNIARLAASHETQAFIVRKSIIAVGLAEIVFNKAVVHPSEGRVEGDSLDYWLQEGSTEATHRAVAEKLIGMSQQSTFATVAQGVPNPSVGFGHYMDQVGDPASLEVESLNGDELGIVKNGLVSQLYKLGNQGGQTQSLELATIRD